MTNEWQFFPEEGQDAILAQCYKLEPYNTENFGDSLVDYFKIPPLEIRVVSRSCNGDYDNLDEYAEWRYLVEDTDKEISN